MICKSAMSTPCDALQPSTDESLMHLVKTGDRQAFAELYRRHTPWLKVFLRRQGAPINAIEELIQESFVTVWQRSNSFDGERARFRTWLTVIARNRCIDLQRRDRSPDYRAQSWMTPAPANCPHSMAVTRETREVIRRAIPNLSEIQRDVIEGAYFHSKSLRVLAEEQGVPLGTIKSRIRLALGALRMRVPPQYAAA